MRNHGRAASKNGIAAPRINIRRGIGAAALVIMAIFTVLAMTAFPKNTHAQEPGEGTTVSENAPGGSTVGTPLRATTSGTPPEYSLSGPDAGSFTIDPTTGEVSLAQNASPDFESRTDYQVTVNAASQVTIQSHQRQ